MSAQSLFSVSESAAGEGSEVSRPAPARRARLPARLAVVVIAAGLAAAPALAGPQSLAQLQKQKGLRPAQKTCVECHGKELEAYKARASSHAPVREGRCEACHLRHGVVGVLRLSADDPALCLRCHAAAEQAEAAKSSPGKAGADKPAGEKVTGAAAKPMSFSHPPGDTLKCGACHDPHGSDKPHLLKAEGSAACLGCHEPARFQGSVSGRFLSLSVIVQDINRFLRGWIAYFRYGNSARQFKSFDRYVKHRLSRFISRKHGRSGPNHGLAVLLESKTQLGLLQASGSIRYGFAHAGGERIRRAV